MKIIQTFIVTSVLMLSSQAFAIGELQLSTYTDTPNQEQLNIGDDKVVGYQLNTECVGCWFNESVKVTGKIKTYNKSGELYHIYDMKDKLEFEAGEYGFYKRGRSINTHITPIIEIDIVASGPHTATKYLHYKWDFTSQKSMSK